MKKIMFNDAFCLTQAVLNGTKTMTRRVERLNPYAHILDEAWNVDGGLNDKGRWIFTLYNKNGDIIGDIIPRYNIGEVVAIAQSYKEVHPNADFEMVGDDFMTESAGWTNKMFVRAELMPHHIRITDVKVERLQDISDDDILREGVWQLSSYDNGLFYVSTDMGCVPTVAFPAAREAFWYLIDKICGKGTWEINPWVVAYCFEVVD